MASLPVVCEVVIFCALRCFRRVARRARRTNRALGGAARRARCPALSKDDAPAVGCISELGTATAAPVASSIKTPITNARRIVPPPPALYQAWLTPRSVGVRREALWSAAVPCRFG